MTLVTQDDHVIGIGEWKVISERGVLVTHALGSCLGLVVHDPIKRVGGLLHAMLPLAGINPQKAEAQPGMFVETGIPLLFRDYFDAGGSRENAIIKAVGCANPLRAGSVFHVGKRNFEVLMKILEKNKLRLAARDVGGTVSRTLRCDSATGIVVLSRGPKRWRL